MNNRSNDTASPSGQVAGSSEFDTSRHSDEIDLIDLWIFFWNRRKVFASSVILIAILGIVCFELVYVPKEISSVHSMIEVHEGLPNQANAVIAFTGMLARRMNIVDLPRHASAQEFDAVRSYVLSSSVGAIPGTSFIEIVTNTPAGSIDGVVKFHRSLLAQIVTKLENTPFHLNDDLENKSESINRGVIRLRSLMRDLDDLLRRDDNTQLFSSPSIQDDVNTRLTLLTAQIDELSQSVSTLDLGQQKVHPRVLAAASVSQKTAGLKKSVAYVLICLLAVFLAIIIIVGSTFAAKVKERMSVRS